MLPGEKQRVQQREKWLLVPESVPSSVAHRVAGPRGQEEVTECPEGEASSQQAGKVAAPEREGSGQRGQPWASERMETLLCGPEMSVPSQPSSEWHQAPASEGRRRENSGQH